MNSNSTQQVVNCTRGELDAEFVGKALCPLQLNYVLQFDRLLLPDPFYAQNPVGESLTHMTALVYQLFGDLCIRNSYLFRVLS